MNHEILREKLRYEHSTGSFYWVQPSKYHKNLTGKKAGRLTDQSYVQIRIDGKIYAAHRLAWLWVYGKMPSGQIDHINGVRSDNRIQNLRDVDGMVNSQNHHRSVKPRLMKSGRYQARIRANNITYYLGAFDTEEEAIDAYNKAREIFHDTAAIC